MDCADPAAGLLAVAGALVAAVGDIAYVVGVDWGDQAADAAAAGVRLVPRGDHAEYLALLSGAHVVIGQTAGILAASELEALAAGAPLVVPVALPLYDDVHPPVYGGSVAEAAEAVRALLDGGEKHDPDAARTWVSEVHGVERAVDTVARVHRDVVAARR
jgi:hypothetical protein